MPSNNKRLTTCRAIATTRANIKDAWRTLKCEGAELQPRTPRDLSAQERLYVIRMAQQGNVTEAIGQFLSYAPMRKHRASMSPMIPGIARPAIAVENRTAKVISDDEQFLIRP